jgi:hypothetical protein
LDLKNEDVKNWRFLDIDDLLIIYYISEGATCKQLANFLNVIQSSISYKLNKHRTIWPDIYFRFKNKTYFNSEYLHIAKKARKILQTLMDE